MKIYSERFKTELEFDDQMIIKMPWGLPGFPDSKQFCILEMEDPDAPFKWFHDVDNTNIALLITDPYQFYADYNPKISQGVLDDLKIKEVESELMVFTIVKVSPGGAEAFTNLRAPVIVNAKTKVARQIILEDDQYAVKTALFSEKQSDKQVANS